MDRSVLPAMAFIDPTGANRKEIAQLLNQVSQHLLDYLTDAAQQSPLPAADTPAVTLPDMPIAVGDLLQQLDQILAQSMNPAHPGYIGHMDPLPTTFSIIGDWLAAALNNNMLSVEMSPVFSRLEPQLMAAIAQRFGLGPKAGGVLVSGGSLANLQALAVARNAKLGTLTAGLTTLPKPPVFFASALAHSSIRKAAMLLGLGQEGVISIPADEQGHMKIEALAAAIAQAKNQGQQPFAVVATAGTTVTGNIDPLPKIAAIAQQQDLWFHVDGAYGGALAFSTRYRDRLKGIEQADSVTFNPQKWLYVAKTCASVLFRDMGKLQQHFQVAAPYMNAEADWINLGEISVQGTRHADVLKLWLSLQHLGLKGCEALIDASYDLTKHFVAAIRQRPYLELATVPEMNVICFRGCPEGRSPDARNQDLQQSLLNIGNGFMSLPVYRQQRWLKAVLLNPFTTPAKIDQLFTHMDDFWRRSDHDR
ncbi:MAG: pyridoxal phosphate-dependent decarboxylase family protein [Leptolyngbyaceae cyanobacterium]